MSLAGDSLSELGRVAEFAYNLLKAAFTFPGSRQRRARLDRPLLFEQLERVGTQSLLVVLITALFTGMVLALQASITLEIKLKGVSQFLGRTVALPFIRELGPVLTGLIVTGRVGSAIAAEIGSMMVTEQVDALKTFGTSPIRYLGVPRLLACLIMLPLLTLLADGVGLLGGFLVSSTMMGVSSEQYFSDIPNMLGLKDLWSGMGKTVFFGGIIAIIACYQGFNTKGGAEGVGRATTTAVVQASILILVSDYFLTAIFALVLGT